MVDIGPPPGNRARRISDRELRDKFNSGGFLSRWKRGLLYDVILEDNIPTSPAAPEPPGTASQVIALVNRRTGRKVAEFHWYLRPDLQVGGRARSADGTGDPDPKLLLEFGVWYAVGFVERG